MFIFSYLKRHAFLVSIILILLVIFGIFAGRKGEESNQESVGNVKTVKVSSAVEFRQNTDTVVVSGTVKSRGQADLKSQVSAPVARINLSIGDRVYLGQTILELENQDLRAQLNQAEAGLLLAQGQSESSGFNFESARRNAIDKIKDSYVVGYDAVISDIDPLLLNSDGQGGRLSDLITDSSLNNRITSTRVDLITEIRDWEKLSGSINVSSSEEEILSGIEYSIRILNKIDSLLADVSEALNDFSTYASPSLLATTNTWKSVVSTSRLSVSGSRTALVGTKSVFSSANTSQGTIAEAQILSAKATVENLRVQLAKTIIRSPINGRVASLPLEVGELASPGQILATVVGEEGYIIQAYSSGVDLEKIKVGSPVSLNNGLKGRVESIAPGVSSLNKKAEVRIAMENSTTTALEFLIGQNVQAIITVSLGSGASSSIYRLPIQAVKIVPGNAFVLTVDEDSKVLENPVILGKVEGGFVEVKSGIKDDMNLVYPVYELDTGQSVIVE